MLLVDYMKPNLQMKPFIFRKTRWQRLKAAVKRWLGKLVGKSNMNLFEKPITNGIGE